MLDHCLHFQADLFMQCNFQICRSLQILVETNLRQKESHYCSKQLDKDFHSVDPHILSYRLYPLTLSTKTNSSQLCPGHIKELEWRMLNFVGNSNQSDKLQELTNQCQHRTKRRILSHSKPTWQALTCPLQRLHCKSPKTSHQAQSF